MTNASCSNEEAVGLLLDYANDNKNGQEPTRENRAIVHVGDSSATGIEAEEEDGVPADRVAAAWVNHLEAGHPAPDAQTLIQLLKAMLHSRTIRPPSNNNRGVKLILANAGKKFPHLLDTVNGTRTIEPIWTQCKTKMTHVAVRLVDENGAPVMGKHVQQGGLQLRLTLHKISDPSTPLTDEDNRREKEGLFRGRASGTFYETVTLLESRHEFKLQLMLLSSDIGGSLMFFKVAPTHPNLAFDDNLIVRTHSFASRARMPDEKNSGEGCGIKRSLEE